jgi:hypothetical protein
VTSFHHQPEAQHPKSSAIHKDRPADYPIYWHCGHRVVRCTCLLLAQSGHQARTHDCMVFLMRGSQRQLRSTVNVGRLIEHDGDIEFLRSWRRFTTRSPEQLRSSRLASPKRGHSRIRSECPLQ